MIDKEYIIIGGGAGGMFAGATLALFGKKVTIIEAHFALGGFASSFKRKDCEHEIAIHAVGNLREDSFEKHWHQKLGIIDHVDYAAIDEFFDVHIGSQYFKIPSTIEKGRIYFLEKFPHEVKGIHQYFDMLINLSLELDGFLNKKSDPFNQLRAPQSIFLLNKTCSEYLEYLFSDELLIKVIQANHQLYHHDPKTLSALNFMFGNTYYMSEGLRFIKGSSHNLIKYLRALIERSGGKILLGHVVNGVELNRDQIETVETVKRSTGEKIKIKGDHFIFNNSPLVVKKWFGQNSDIINCSEKISYSSCNIYLEYNKSPKDFGVKAYMNSIILSGREKAKMLDVDQLAFIDYSQIDSDLSDNKFLASIIYLDHYQNWSELSKKEYDAKKIEKQKIIFDILDNYFPGLSGEVSRVDFATPLTIERYTQNPNGASYGFSCSAKDLVKDQDLVCLTKEYNMSFASAWVYGGGLSLTGCSGIKAALDIMGVDYFEK